MIIIISGNFYLNYNLKYFIPWLSFSPQHITTTHIVHLLWLSPIFITFSDCLFLFWFLIFSTISFQSLHSALHDIFLLLPFFSVHLFKKYFSPGFSLLFLNSVSYSFSSVVKPSHSWDFLIYDILSRIWEFAWCL